MNRESWISKIKHVVNQDTKEGEGKGKNEEERPLFFEDLHVGKLKEMGYVSGIGSKEDPYQFLDTPEGFPYRHLSHEPVSKEIREVVLTTNPDIGEKYVLSFTIFLYGVALAHANSSNKEEVWVTMPAKSSLKVKYDCEQIDARRYLTLRSFDTAQNPTPETIIRDLYVFEHAKYLDLPLNLGLKIQ